MTYNEETGEISEVAIEAMTAWSDTKACKVCGVPIPAYSRVNVCGIQDASHNSARSSAA